MNLRFPDAAPALPDKAVPGWLTLLLAAACGLIVANIYYAQPLAGPISRSLGLTPGAAGLIVTMTQIGYGIGLLLIVPLGDLVETRRLVLSILAMGILALAAAAMVDGAAWFLAASLFIGLGSVSVQVLVPYAAHLAPEAGRGRVVGNVMSGIMLGIMLSRPAASLVAHMASWHMVYVISACVMVVLGLVLRLVLPQRQPPPGPHYLDLLGSMVVLARHTKVLQRRAIYHAFLFAAFSLFWTATPMLLARTYHLSQSGIALFALAGVSGAVSAPLAGRAADRGWSRVATRLAMLAVAAGFLLTLATRPGGTIPLALLTVAAIVLDFGVTANLVLGQRAIFMLAAHHRSRLNGLYMAFFFSGGAIGSALGGWAFNTGGWGLSAWIGVSLPVAALLFHATEPRQGPDQGDPAPPATLERRGSPGCLPDADERTVRTGAGPGRLVQPMGLRCGT